jgi:phosphatidylglycerol:prolipoprotein diacylglycerol transferase
MTPSPITFPGLGNWKFYIPTDVFSVGNFRITWYGLLIAIGLVLAMFYAMKRAKDFKITVDDLTDVLIFSLIFAIVGARLYYVVFDPNRSVDYKSFLDVISLWNGGLAIYGGFIGAFVTAYIVCRIKKISVGSMFDIAALGFLIGQAIGRWGNFVNQEAYGSITTKLPWRMGIIDANIYDSTFGKLITVNPCFLYESLWCVLGFILLHIYSKKHRKFNGEIFLMYVMWYGFGRFFIEGLRTDSLMIGATVKVSQLLAAVLFVAALIIYIYKRSNVKGAHTDVGYVSVYEEAAKALAEEDAEIKTRQHIEHEPDEDDADDDDDDDDEVFPDDEPGEEEPVAEKDDTAYKKKD